MNPFTRWKKGEHTPEVFDLMCAKHDLTYAMSDHRDTWVRGHEQLSDISEAAMTLGPIAKEIWNRNVRLKLAPIHAQDFEW